MVHKIISFILFILFATFAYVQVNDPDPYLWILAYAVVSLICLGRTFGYSWKYINLSIHIILVISSLFFVSGTREWLMADNHSEIFGEMVYEKAYIEETREFLGLTIAALVMFYQYKIAISEKV